MTTKEFEKIGKALLPELPGFAVKGYLLLIPPVKQILRGICFEPSGFDKQSFYVWVFFLPLFVPRKHVSFEFGRRIGHNWKGDAQNLLHELSGALKREALPFLSPIESPRDVAQAAKSLRLPQNPNVQQAIAYALARAGDVNEAVAALDELTRSLDVKVPWQLEMFERANALKPQLLSDAPGAQKQLEAWETESATNLRLEKFR